MQAFRKILLLVLTIFLFNTTYATNYYVDKNATGSNNGTSWTNAWQSFSAISWGSINPGDIVFISGGTDSLVYSETLYIGADGNSTNLITISKGRDTGHNGKVIVQGPTPNPNRSGLGLDLRGRSYVRVVGISIRTWFQAAYLYSGNVLYVDSCTVNNCQWGINVGLSGSPSDSIYVLNSHLVCEWTTELQTDLLGGSYCDNFVVKNCYIYQGNRFSKNGHSDCIQCYTCGKQTYANNWLESVASGGDSSAAAGGNCQVAAIEDTSLWYNNVIIIRGWSWSLYHDAGTIDHTWVMINNTIIKEYIGVGGGSVDTIEPETFAGNNIFYSTSDYVGSVRLQTTLSPGNSNFDYNHYYHPNYASVVNGYTLAGWQAVGGDVHGSEGDPLFVNFNSPNDLDLRLQEGSPCIGEGTADVRAFIESWGLEWESFNNIYIPWANGGARSETTPSIGAYEGGVTTVDQVNNGLPKEFSLHQNYPNPFNPTTSIRYSIPLEGLVILKVYNTIGEEMTILVNEIKQVGNYEVEFDASNLPSGIYFYKLQANNFVQVKKMILLK